ncbi:hypothetical protein [Streptomyces sp. NBC_01304]|uniref:hypothetical protein n=1 Tax=Streptomyces sp. NBC_01304 TaxID=2903818 RepID=UPI002E1626E8|nr:hypothetical protein OG430_11390 [Streptomyces sp. NBC_01304]
MTMVELAGDVLIAALAIRVFGRDALRLLRRAAAAGVRVGVTELGRADRGEVQE